MSLVEPLYPYISDRNGYHPHFTQLWTLNYVLLSINEKAKEGETILSGKVRRKAQLENGGPCAWGTDGAHQQLHRFGQ